MKRLLTFVSVFAFVGAAFAELQTVQVGGELRIRANYYMNTFTSPGAARLRWPALAGFNTLSARPIGTFGGIGNGIGILSPFAWDSEGNDLDYVEQRTRLNVKADFTNEVSAFIELDSYDIWGEDFRSNWITGADVRSTSVDDVEVYQAYIEANEMWGLPLRARIGRQELSFGSQWLVGVNDASQGVWGLSFDALRLTYATDVFSVDAWA
ncbi:MAG TPA: alginate export family protein, partial [Candidatus Hydrogenedentes bacterium]|nr:alginate export family protein [Candidatus Hydrogenedentota bacterium]